MEPVKKKRGRPAGKKRAEHPEPTLHLDPEVDQNLTVHAKKLKLSKRKYANAAIAYFAQSGLNPAAARDETLAGFSAKLKQEGLVGRQQTVLVGNRLIEIIRNWEKQLYDYLALQQQGTLNYLEHIENSLLQQLVGLEANYISPLVEMMVKNNIESYMTRVIALKTGLHITGVKKEDWDAETRDTNKQRDQQLMLQMREFLKNNRMPAPTLAPKPQVPARPAKRPVNPPPAGGVAPK